METCRYRRNLLSRPWLSRLRVLLLLARCLTQQFLLQLNLVVNVSKPQHNPNAPMGVSILRELGHPSSHGTLAVRALDQSCRMTKELTKNHIEAPRRVAEYR